MTFSPSIFGPLYILDPVPKFLPIKLDIKPVIPSIKDCAILSTVCF